MPFSLDIQQIFIFVLILIRIMGILFALPFFGDSYVPLHVRLLFSVALTFFFTTHTHTAHVTAVESSKFLLIVVGVFKELLIGLAIGFLAKITFEGVIMAANLVSYQMGFGTANLLMPGSDTQLNAFTALHRMVTLFFFLSLSLHFMFIQALADTFKYIPLQGLSIHGLFGSNIVSFSAHIFTIAIQLSAPILVALLLTMTALGLISKSVPQLNIFTISFPASFFVGLSVYVLMSSFLPGWMKAHFTRSGHELLASIHALAP
ncbi:MAG: flagellar biosynthetic protein FliR [Zetaproteobacteria bacterium]|nr:flagellar biosynthetic protein FliR [Zetaproteobacteria bacterium]